MIRGGLIEVRAPSVSVFLQLLLAVFYLSLLVQAFTCIVQICTLIDFGWFVPSVTTLGKSPTMSVDFVSPFYF